MNWDTFIWFALPAMILWASAGIVVYRKKSKVLADILMIAGISIYTLFIIGFWINIERPPLRTMGETRLWYSFFLSVVGYVTYCRWKYPWLLSFSALVASVFICINRLSRKSTPKPYASPAKHMVYTPRHLLYPLLCHVWRCNSRSICATKEN